MGLAWQEWRVRLPQMGSWILLRNLHLSLNQNLGSFSSMLAKQGEGLLPVVVQEP